MTTTEVRRISEGELASEVQREGAQDLAILFVNYSWPVYSVALRVLRDVSAAEDVLQDVFLKISLAPINYMQKSRDIRTWLETIALNRSIDVLRRKYLIESFGAVPIQTSTHVFEDVDRALMMTRAKLLIRRLPKVKRQVIEMAFIREMSHMEVARELNIPLGTAKTRIRAGIHALAVAI